MQSTFLTRLRAWFAQGNRTTWTVFFLFSVALFVKTMIFHWTCFHCVLISSLWTNPTEFFRFWGGKIVPILFLGSFVFITKRYWWTVFVNLLVDIWMIANLFYYKANTLFLSVEIMKMADNMDGFWDSLLAYMGWDIFSLPIITIFYIAILCLLHLYRSPKRKYPHFVITMVASIALAVLCNYFYGIMSKSWNSQDAVAVERNEIGTYHYYYPFGNVYYWAYIQMACDSNVYFITPYVSDFSILSYFPACLLFDIVSPDNEIIQLTDSQQEEIEKHIHETDNVSISPKTNLIFVLFFLLYFSKSSYVLK